MDMGEQGFSLGSLHTEPDEMVHCELSYLVFIHTQSHLWTFAKPSSHPYSFTSFRGRHQHGLCQT